MKILSASAAALTVSVTAALSVLNLGFSFMLNCWYTFLTLLATPFWLVEFFLSRGRLASVRLATLSNCETYVDWAFSRSNPDQPKQHLTFVRLWGIEVQHS